MKLLVCGNRHRTGCWKKTDKTDHLASLSQASIHYLEYRKIEFAIWWMKLSSAFNVLFDSHARYSSAEQHHKKMIENGNILVNAEMLVFAVVELGKVR